MRNKSVVFFLSMLAILFLTSCSDAAATRSLRVALVLAGSLKDGAQFDSCNEGLVRARRELGVEAKVLECAYDPDNDLPYLVTASRNFDMVFVVGPELLPALEEVAPQFPKTDYVYVDALPGQIDNDKTSGISSVAFRTEEASYLAGILAANYGRSSCVGAILGKETPWTKRVFSGYEQGVRRVDPQMRILAYVVESWNDPERAREKALKLNARGASVILEASGKSREGVLKASEEARLGVIVTTSLPLKKPLSRGVLAVLEKRCGLSVYELIKARKEGTFRRGHLYSYGIREGGVDLVWGSENSRRTLPRALLRKIGRIRDQIVAGTLIVSVGN